MVREDITPEMQAEYEKQLKESAEKGGKYIAAISTLYIGLTVLNVLSGSLSVLIAAIRILVLLFLLKGSNISRALFMLGTGISLVIEIINILAVVAVVQDIGLNFAALAAFILLALDLIISATVFWLLFFNKDVDNFFNYSHSYKNKR